MATSLTDRKVARAKPADKEYRLSDGGGLYLRVHPAGTKSWLARVEHKGKRRTLQLGTYPAVSLAAAREHTREFRERVLNGEPVFPVSEEVPKTLDQLFYRWFDDYVLENRSSEDNNNSVKSRYEKYVKPILGDSDLSHLRRGIVLTVLDRVVKLGHLRTANLILSELRQMFTYAAVREWILGDPTAGILKKDVGGEESVGERILSEDELRLIKDVISAPGRSGEVVFSGVLPFSTEMAVWLALSTLARSVEIATAKAEDVDVDAGTWNIPPEVAKNTLGHLVHLNGISKKVFEILLARNPKGYLFPGRGGGHMCPKSFTKALKTRQGGRPIKGRACNSKLKLPGGPWTMHDLRRTGATMLGEMDFDEKLIDLCLNHREVKKVRRTYQKQQRLPARREAFEALGEKLIELFGGDDFLPNPLRPQPASQQS